MKKLFLGLLAVLLGLSVSSCKQEAPKSSEEAQAALENAINEIADALSEDAVDLGALIDLTKAEGAKWTEEEWKDAIKKATLAVKPMMVEMSEIEKKMEAAKDPEEIAKLASELEKVPAKYGELEKQVEEFDQLINGNEIAKKLNNDKAFQKEVVEELGLEGLGDF